MAKHYSLKIERCRGCPNQAAKGWSADSGWKLVCTARLDFPVKDERVIPDWCPLPEWKDGKDGE